MKNKNPDNFWELSTHVNLHGFVFILYGLSAHTWSFKAPAACKHRATWKHMINHVVGGCFFFLSQLRFYFLRNWQEKHKRTQQPQLFPVLDVIFRASDEEIEEADTGGEGNQELGFKIGLRCHDRKGGEDSRRSGCLIENSGGGGGDLRSESWKQLTGNSAPRLQRHEQNYVSLQNSRSQDVCSLQHTGVKCAEHTVPEWNATHGCCCWCACVMTPMYLTPLTLSSDVYFRIKSLEWTFRGAGFGLRAISWLTLT